MYGALLVLNLVCFGLVCAAYVRHPACGWFHPLTPYLAFHGLVFVVRPIFAWFFDFQLVYRVFEFTPDAYARNMALVVANCGLFSFAAASLHWGNARFRNKLDRATVLEAQALARPLWLLSLILLPVIAYSLFVAWQLRATDLAGLELDSSTGTTINREGNGYVQTAYWLSVTLVPLIAFVGRFKAWALVPAVVFVFLLSGSGLRGPIISMLDCLACLYLYARGRRRVDWRIVALGLLSVPLFIHVGADRGYAVRAILTDEASATSYRPDQLAPLEGMDAANLEFLEYLVDTVPRRTGTYEYFIDNLQVFTEPIPRMLWRDKPVGQPIRLFYLFDYGFPIGMTRSLPGEGWTQLGLVGVVIWCGLWGAFCGAIYNRYARSRQTVLQTACYFAFVATLIVFYRDGLLMTLLKQGLFFLLPPLLLALLARLMAVPGPAALRRRASAGPAGGRRLRGRERATVDPEGPSTAPAFVPRSRRHGRASLPPARG